MRPRARRASPWVAAAPAVLALLLWLGPYGTAHYTTGEIVDTPVYQTYADAVWRGDVPYRDFAVEYPPLALLPMLAPRIVADDPSSYARAYRLAMGLMAAALAGAVALAARAAGRPATAVLAAGAVAAVAPLAIGSVLASRFDLWPALLVALALLALHARRPDGAAALTALGVAAKLWPGALLPVVLAVALRRGGPRAAARSLAVFALVLALVVVPVALVAPDGLLESVRVQASRPLQVESVGATLLVVVERLRGAADLAVVTGSGSQNLVGPGVDAATTALAVLQPLALLVAVAAGARAILRAPDDDDAIVPAAAAAILALVAFGRVLSPQFMAWLIPVTALLAVARHRLGVLTAGLVGGAWLLTQVEFPARYWLLGRDLDAGTAALVLARDALLAVAYVVALVLLARLATGPARAGSR